MGSFRLLFDHGGNDNISELSTDRNFVSFDDDGNDHGDKENDNVDDVDDDEDDDDDDDARSENREQRVRLVT